MAYNKINDKLIEKIKKEYEVIKNSRKVAEKLNVSRYSVMKYANIKSRNGFTEEERIKNLSRKVTEWRKNAKIKLVEYKGGECCKCGYKKCISALEFHHLDPKEKDFTISGKSWSFERLKKEADKCILVCSNCHKEIHEGIL